MALRAPTSPRTQRQGRTRRSSPARIRGGRCHRPDTGRTVEHIQARHYTKANRRPHEIRLEVIHAMQAPEKPTTAEGVARYFATTTKRASAHTCHDNDSSIRCVLDKDVAYAAPGANHDGRQYELAGYAEQTEAEWKDKFSLAMLARVAVLVNHKCQESGNAMTWLSDREIAMGRRGICDHWAISRIYKRSSHWDTGPNFPKDLFVDMVRAAEMLPVHPTPSGGTTIMLNAQAFLVCPVDGGYQKLQADGGVFNDGCTHYHGSYLEDSMAEARKGQPDLPFTHIERVPGGDGTLYAILRQDGAVYGPAFA